MQLDFAMLALAADSSKDGKLHIFGGAFDVLTFSGVPAPIPPPIPPFNLVARFQGTNQEESGSRHVLSLAITNPNGERTILMDRIEFGLSTPDYPQYKSSALVLVSLGVAFGSFGKYIFDISADGNLVKQIELHVIQSMPQVS